VANLGRFRSPFRARRVCRRRKAVACYPTITNPVPVAESEPRYHRHEKYVYDFSPPNTDRVFLRFSRGHVAVFALTLQSKSTFFVCPRVLFERRGVYENSRSRNTYTTIRRRLNTSNRDGGVNVKMKTHELYAFFVHPDTFILSSTFATLLRPCVAYLYLKKRRNS